MDSTDSQQFWHDPLLFPSYLGTTLSQSTSLKNAVLRIWGFGIFKGNEIMRFLSLKALSIKNSVEQEDVQIEHQNCQTENGRWHFYYLFLIFEFWNFDQRKSWIKKKKSD